MSFDGVDLRPLWQTLIAKVIDGSAEAGEGLDLSLVAQLLGDKRAGLAIQDEILASHQLFRSPCLVKKPRLRVLALAAATDMGSNTPIEFLLEESGIELMTLYVIPEAELPEPLPDHDIAIVIASDSEECRGALSKIDQAASCWPRPLLNPPHLVCNLDRDKLHRLLDGIAGLQIPATTSVAREQLLELSHSSLALADIAADLAFPVIARPRGSHAGVGLAKIDDCASMEIYLRERQEQEYGPPEPGTPSSALAIRPRSSPGVTPWPRSATTPRRSNGSRASAARSCAATELLWNRASATSPRAPRSSTPASRATGMPVARRRERGTHVVPHVGSHEPQLHIG